MGVIKKMRKQRAVWWARNPTPSEYGQFTFQSPVEVRCRWDDTSVEFLDAEGEKVLSDAVAYVDRVMTVGDRLMRGELESDTPEDPMDSGCLSYEIRRFDQNPNFKATETLFTAFM